MLLAIFGSDDDDAQPDRDRGDSVPAGFRAAGSGSAVSLRATCATPPSAAELNEFQTQRSELRANVAAEIGLTLLSASVSGRRLIVVQDFYRGARCEGSDGSTILYGASARLIVDIAGFDAKAQLTLPAIAAQVQMGMASAQYKLTARGYVGPLSEVLVDPGELNVESYVKLLASITLLQKRLADDTVNIRPVPLFVDLPVGDVEMATRRRSIGVTFALSQIADGRSLNAARREVEWSSWATEAQEAINETYDSIVGTDADLRPGTDAQNAARSYLGHLRLK